MFRFEDLASGPYGRRPGGKIWQMACDSADVLCDIADSLDKKRLYRFAEQLRAAALSISNNIAEGSGSTSTPEFKSFLNYARRSVFECASMLAFFCRKGYITSDTRDKEFTQLDLLSRKITSFSRAL